VVATDLGHPPDHPTAEPLGAPLRCDQDLLRAEHIRARSTLREPRFDDGIESSVRQARGVSVPPGGNRVPHTDGLLALVVPRVELKLGVLADHAFEEAFENGRVVQELGPEPLLETGCVWEPPAGPLGTRGKLERHL